MPELPEVETMVRDLAQRLAGRTIVSVDLLFPGELKYPGPGEFVQRIQGRRIERLARRGKYAVFLLQGGDALIIHRGMSGSLLLREPHEPMESHVRVLVGLDDGRHLRFNDPRKFGAVYLMDASGTERPLPWNRMGPEPLDRRFTASSLQERV